MSIDKYQHEDASLRRNRGGWRTHDRRLRHIRSRHRFDDVGDLAALIPEDLPSVFTTADLSGAAGTSRSRAQKMAYCLRDVGLFELVGRGRKGYEYRVR